MDIQINDINYHGARLDNNDIKYIKSIIDKTIEKYPDLDKYIKNVFKENGIILNDCTKNDIVINIFAAFLHSLKDNEEINNEDRLLKILKGYTRNYLESIFENRKNFISLHPVQYEPKVVCILAFSNYVNREFSEEFDKEFAKNPQKIFDTYFHWEFINAFRVLKSSMLLFAIGDDVHGIGLYRGFMEIWSKLVLAEKFKEDYFKFKQYNLFLQVHKSTGEPLPQEMIDDIGKKNSTNENFLAYGWAKNKNGKRITTLTEFVNFANNNDPKIKEFLHYSGEFIHEDYVGVGYDYLVLRKRFIDTYFEISKFLFDGWENSIKNKKINDLYKNIVI